jgi:ribosomal protein S4E
VPWREVGFGDKIELVSVMDGYRVMYSYPRTLWFATLKAERSDRARYLDDKRIVTENFVMIAREDGDAALSKFSDSGFEGQTLTKKSLGGRTLGITQILSDEDAVIVTIYFANQAPENRAFQTYEEFLALRDDFVRGYLVCVASRKAQTR